MKINILGYILMAFVLIIAYRIFQESEYLNLKCIISGVDGKRYCVRERSKLTLAADLLATINLKMNKLVTYVGNKYPDRENIKRLVNGYNPKKISETLPTSEYTAYSENKGEKIAFCLNTEKKKGSRMIDENTLMFVALHELSHVATKSIGHTEEFWNNFKFLLKEADKIKIYTPEDYKKNNKRYCGTSIVDNPYFDL
jgi:predicted metal-dependent hydrolase|tara:strand:- start:98 stop:691 length:594 start_codon:yes stop_codon:yes gene_type:complete